MLEKILERPLDRKEIKPVYFKGNQTWLFIERTDAEVWILCSRAMKGSLEKTLMLGEIEGRRKWGWQRMRCLASLTDSMDINLSKLCETVEDREAWLVAVLEVTMSQIWLSNWTTAMTTAFVKRCFDWKVIPLVPGKIFMPRFLKKKDAIFIHGGDFYLCSP